MSSLRTIIDRVSLLGYIIYYSSDVDTLINTCNYINIDAREMGLGLLDHGEGEQYTGVGFVKITKLFVVHGTLFSGNNLFDKVENSCHNSRDIGKI